ncbi:MAG: hypothetical protein HYX75_03360 [Acidobacteria bacterium]|nr:hypothetical protein [Acidobacteriota bacterium]
MQRLRNRVILLAAALLMIGLGLQRQVSWNAGSAAVQASAAPANVTVSLTATLEYGLVCCYKYTAKVLSSGYPYPGMVVKFTVKSGPYAGQTTQEHTNSNGEASWTLCNTGSLGTQVVEAESEGAKAEQSVDYTGCVQNFMLMQAGSRTGCSCND